MSGSFARVPGPLPACVGRDGGRRKLGAWGITATGTPCSQHGAITALARPWTVNCLTNSPIEFGRTPIFLIVDMTEQIHDLRAALVRLHTELEGIESLDPQKRKLLPEALSDIQQTLDRLTAGGELAVPHDETLSHRLAEAARHFEETHPTLSGMIGSVIDALSRMGI